MNLVFDGVPATLSTAEDSPLVRAVIISLFSDARADESDGTGDDRRGWWGDTYADAGESTGSKLWILMRDKVTAETMIRAQAYAEEALRWLIDDAVAEDVSVAVERNELDRVDISVTITKPTAEKINIRFQDVWEKI